MPHIEVTMEQLLHMEIFDKEKLFKSLYAPIQFAMKTAYNKFEALPIEMQDLLCDSWEAFEKAIELYVKGNIKRPFVNFLIQEINRACTRKCAKFLSGRYRIVNNSIDLTIDAENLCANSLVKDFTKDIEVVSIIESYCRTKHDDSIVTKDILLKFVYGATMIELSKEYNIPRSTLSYQFKQAFAEMKELWTE